MKKILILFLLAFSFALQAQTLVRANVSSVFDGDGCRVRFEPKDKTTEIRFRYIDAHGQDNGVCQGGQDNFRLLVTNGRQSRDSGRGGWQKRIHYRNATVFSFWRFECCKNAKNA